MVETMASNDDIERTPSSSRPLLLMALLVGIAAAVACGKSDPDPMPAVAVNEGDASASCVGAGCANLDANICTGDACACSGLVCSDAGTDGHDGNVDSASKPPSTVVLFGGLGLVGDADAPLGDTWTFDGGSWSEHVVANPPPARTGHSMATFGDAVILFGGKGADLKPRNDTWKWDGVAWRQVVTPIAPAARSGAAMTAFNGAVVLFGGYGYNDTWTFDGATWTEVTVAAAKPAAYVTGAIAAFGSTIILGCDNTDYNGPGPVGHRWTFDGNAWTKVVKVGAGGVEETTCLGNITGTLTAVGNVLFATTGWFFQTYDGVATSAPASFPWGPAPFPNFRMQVAAAALGSKVVMFGGYVTTVWPNRAVDETWTWDGAWSQVLVASSPPARWQAAMATVP